MIKYIHIVLIIIILFYFITKTNTANLKMTIIIKSNKLCLNKKLDSVIEYCITIENKIKLKKYNISSSYLFIEHNMMFDDILFLIPLYNIIIKSSITAICSGCFSASNIQESYYHAYTHNFSLNQNCLYFNINYLKLLHIHTNMFRKCSFNAIYDKFKNNDRKIRKFNKICNNDKYTTHYSIVTTIYRRESIYDQINYFTKQTIPPSNIIVVHDRNFIVFNYNITAQLIYIHALNFVAGFYFRYLLALLSSDEDIFIYDDDFLPKNKKVHEEWLKSIRKKNYGIYCHRSQSIESIRWCATPLIIKRKLLFLEWIYKIYEPTQAEDGHLSFSVLLLCNISSNIMKMKGLTNIKDNLSSPRKKLNTNFWLNYIRYIREEFNSTYIIYTKDIYYIT